MKSIKLQLLVFDEQTTNLSCYRSWLHIQLINQGLQKSVSDTFRIKGKFIGIVQCGELVKRYTIRRSYNPCSVRYFRW